MSAPPPPENKPFVNGPPMENRDSTENTPFMSGPCEPPPPYQSVVNAQDQSSYPIPPIQSNYPLPPPPLPPQNYPPPQMYPPAITSAGMNSYQTNDMSHVAQPVQQQPYKGNVIQETVVIQQQPVMHLSTSVNYTEHPITILCHHCNNSVMTYVEYTSGVFTWMLCLLLLLVGCWPCCCVPFCLDSCQDVVHRCHTCQKVVGVYKRC